MSSCGASEINTISTGYLYYSDESTIFDRPRPGRTVDILITKAGRRMEEWYARLVPQRPVLDTQITQRVPTINVDRNVPQSQPARSRRVTISAIGLGNGGYGSVFGIPSLRSPLSTAPPIRGERPSSVNTLNTVLDISPQYSSGHTPFVDDTVLPLNDSISVQGERSQSATNIVTDDILDISQPRLGEGIEKILNNDEKARQMYQHKVQLSQRPNGFIDCDLEPRTPTFPPILFKANPVGCILLADGEARRKYLNRLGQL